MALLLKITEGGEGEVETCVRQKESRILRNKSLAELQLSSFICSLVILFASSARCHHMLTAVGDLWVRAGITGENISGGHLWRPKNFEHAALPSSNLVENKA